MGQYPFIIVLLDATTTQEKNFKSPPNVVGDLINYCVSKIKSCTYLIRRVYIRKLEGHYYVL